MLKPLKVCPVFKEIIWGGNRLKNEYNKHSDLSNIAESWELSCRDDGMDSLIDKSGNTETLREYLDKNGMSVVSDNETDEFPLLIKFIDANDNLSVQVHPDNEYARLKENSFGKTEMWYIIDAKPGSKLVYGLKNNCSVSELSESIKDGTVEDCLNYVEVKKGDVYFIPSGLVHAIGAGILLAEIQQNSNITYRVYDYNRMGKDGKPRQLHINDALNVIKNYSRSEIDSFRFSNNNITDTTLASCKYFTVNKYMVNSEVSLEANEHSFNSVLCLCGDGYILYNEQEYVITKGDSYFIPAGIGKYIIRGNLEIIVSKL